MENQPEIQDEMKEILDKPEDKGIAEAAASAEDKEPKDEGEQAEKPESQEHKNRVPAKDRIRQLRAKLGDRDRENQFLRQENEKLKNGSTHQESNEPKIENFNSQDDYVNAVIDYRADLKASETLKIKDAKDAEARQQAAAKKIQDDWTRKQKKATERYPDFPEMENDLILDIQDLGAVNLFDDILEADHGTEIVAFLHKHPAELERIASLQPRAATREIGKLEIKLAEKPGKKSTPPTPTETLRGGAPIKKDIGQMSQAEYNAHMNARMRGR
jgi:hypothetical protein